jgi:hypothetical protein
LLPFRILGKLVLLESGGQGVDNLNRRSTLVVYPDVQKRIIAVFVLAGAIGFMGLSAAAALFSREAFTLIEPYVSAMPAESQIQLSSLWNYFWIFAVAFGLVYIGLLFFIGLVISHRLAGPLYAISSQMAKMVETNNFERITIRESDFFGKAVTTLNEAIAKRKSS